MLIFQSGTHCTKCGRFASAGDLCRKCLASERLLQARLTKKRKDALSVVSSVSEGGKRLCSGVDERASICVPLLSGCVGTVSDNTGTVSDNTEHHDGSFVDFSFPLKDPLLGIKSLSALDETMDVALTPLTCAETLSVGSSSLGAVRELEETWSVGSSSLVCAGVPEHGDDASVDSLQGVESDNDSVSEDSSVDDSSEEEMSGFGATDVFLERCHVPVVLPNMQAGAVCSRFCGNCNRESLSLVEGDSSFLGFELSEFPVSSVTNREKRWMTFQRQGYCFDQVWLCQQCQMLLLNTERSRRNKEGKHGPPWKHVWPVYMWKLLTDEGMLERYGCDILHWVPISVWRFWGTKLCLLFPQWYGTVNFVGCDSAKPVVIDGTIRKEAFLGILQRNLLGELKRGCNEYLIPNVLCPWGCSGYIHDTGCVSYDAIINRFFPFVIFAGSMSTSVEKSRVESARPDFLSTEIDMHLYNDEWSVHPTVEFTLDGPVVLTCDAHDKGTTNKYFHLPKSTGCVPATHSDVLSHAVISAKVIHRTKAHHYSTTYQLNKCTGSYSGIECSHVSDNRHFDFLSHLTDLNEARSYAGRVDIKGLVGRLAQQRVISEELANNYAERAESLFGDTPLLESLAAGATMITLHDSMKLQEMLSTHPISIILIDSDKDGNVLLADKCHQRTIRRQWPTSLIHIHPNDEYGARINKIPYMQSKNGTDFRLLWNLFHCLLGVPCLWEAITLDLQRTSDWYGLVLSYLSKEILKQTVKDKQFRGDPFDVKATDPRSKPTGLLCIIGKYCDRVDGGLHKFDDKNFCPSDFVGLFSGLASGGYMKVAEIPVGIVSSSVVGTLNADCNVLLFHRKIAGSKMPLEMLLDCSGSDARFELRFVSASKTTLRPKGNGHIWDAEVWIRHGGGVFDKWWYTKRSLGHTPCKKDSLDGILWESVDVAVYVRCGHMSLAKYRSEYLRYIGGQGKVICKVHQVPLITSHRKRGECLLNCTVRGDKCKALPEYECPVETCSSCICKPCFLSVPEDASVLEVIQSEVVIPAEDLVDGSESDSDHLSESDSVSNEGTASIVRTLSSEKDSDSISTSDLSSEDEVNIGDSYANLPTGATCLGFGTGDFAPETGWNCDDAVHEPLMHTTLHSEEENLIDGGMGFVGTSVLLNKCGTMLVRRDSQLQANRRERHILERIVSRKDIGTVPLVYLEGILFPSIFWCLPQSTDGGILGSMPTSLFCQGETRKRLRVASMADHAKTRLKSVGNTASCDPRYLTFMFDSVANGAIEGSDTRVVLSRGFEESMGPAGMRMRNHNDNLYSDTIDNRQCVHDLSASERESVHDVFVTLTANQREHFGLQQIKRYIDDGDALLNYKRHFQEMFPNEKELTFASEREVQKALQEASMTITVRNWMEIRKILIQYLLNSPELPLGSPVEKIFVRDEYQGDSGNLSHLHLLAALQHKYSTPLGKRQIESVISGYVDDIVTVDEVPAYIAEGLITDWDDYERMKDQARRYLAHHCSERCMRRTGPGINDLVCRVPDARYVSPDITKFSARKIDTVHSSSAIAVMEQLGLCCDMKESNGVFVPTRDYLVSKRIYAPVRHGEGNISPVVGRLFAATRSAMNIQICTSNGTTRYVVKYLIKVDENNYVTFGAKHKDDSPAIKAEKVFLSNTKVTSSAINEAKKLNQSRHRDKQKGRVIACTEMIQLLLGFPQVHCNTQFIRVPTLPLGERPGLERESPKCYFERTHGDCNVDSFSIMVPAVMARETLFRGRSEYRKHTASQISMLRDQMLSKVTLDRVFLFSVRPPELLFVDKMEWYFKLFRRTRERVDGSLNEVLKLQLENSPLVDGLGYQLELREKGIPLLKEILVRRTCNSMSQYGYTRVRAVFMKAIKYYEAVGLTVGCGSATRNVQLSKGSAREWEIIQHNLIYTDDINEHIPIIVFSNVRPANASKFIIHLLLSMGHFATERDLWMHASLRDAFVAASLVKSNVVQQSDVDSLLRDWVEDQLRYYPITAKKFDEYLVAAADILTSVLMHNSIPINEMPPVMYAALVKDTSEKIEQHIKECRTVLVDATLKSISQPFEAAGTILPGREALIKSSRSKEVDWNHVLPKSARQSNASYSEQLRVQASIVRHINTYCVPSTVAAKNILIAGPPGVGKTHCLSHGIIYALCKGLTVMTTAMLADRAFLLGGKHLHKLFSLRARDRGSPHRLAELAVISLQKKPYMFEFLRRLDVLFIDECGQVSAELLTILDIVTRKIRDSSLFMGGILVIGTIDQVQLQPINGLPFLLSPYVLTTFSMVILKEYVRCADCPVLQEMNEIARSFPETKEEWDRLKRRLRYLLSKHCTFVDSWDSPLITDIVLRIFPKREETTNAVRRFLDNKKTACSLANDPYLTVRAEDTMLAMESHGNWKPATRQVSSYLTSKVREPERLDFYKGALYQFTYNSPGKFNATQLALLLEVPTREQLESFSEISILVAPPGTKAVDTQNLPTEQTPGWRKTTIGSAPENALNLWSHGVKAKRKQYGLKHHIASTIHSAIGHTVAKIATELGLGKDLWERAMVVVLISRVSEATDLIFVGNKRENINAILRGLSIKSQYDEYMNHVVKVLSSYTTNNPAKPINMTVHPFRQQDIAIPSDTSGVVYMLVSVRCGSAVYIGLTQDMNKRLKQHNSGIGAQASSDPAKRPWGLLAYVTGFQYDRALMRQFELRWQNIVAYTQPANAIAAATLATTVIERFYNDCCLQLVMNASDT